MERVGDMTREELKQLVGEVVEERLERALRENGVRRASRDSAPEGMTRRELLQSIRRSSEKFGRAHKAWTNPVMEEREANRKRSWVETSEQIDRVGWTLPPDSQTAHEMLREDRDR